MHRFPARGNLGLIVTVVLTLSTGARGDALDDAFAREQALEQQAMEVNGGQLEFLAEPPAEAVHGHTNRITLLPASLQDGWVQLEQCHDNLDPVAATEIVFHPDRVRDLDVSDHAHIGQIIIDGPRVQLTDVQPGARICITAQSRALSHAGDGQFVLRNGPWMRRFLDGYYPLHVRMEVRWPAGSLHFLRALPVPQPGLALASGPGRLALDTWFRGKLSTELYFQDARVSLGP